MLIRSLAPVIAALLLAGFVVTFGNNATSTPSLPPGIEPLGTATTTATTTPSKVKETKPPKKLSDQEKLTQAGGKLLNAIVNIYCTTDSSAPFLGASGSGVIIDSRGLILTASHVAQFFLLTDYPKQNAVQCVIRTGGPAHDAYTAQAVYVSPSWIDANARTLRTLNPRGNGQHDFAVLAITGSANGITPPKTFPALPLSEDAVKIGDRLAIGGYAAQYLGSQEIKSMLYPTITFDPVSDEYTFGKNNIDVLSIKGTAAAQEGSSGGGLANAEAEIVGVISNSATTGAVKNHELNAITPSHIRSSFKADMGTDFDTYFSSHSLPELIALFAPKAFQLRGDLINALSK